MNRTACFGYCPDYTIKLDSDGNVKYEGSYFVGAKGIREYKVGETQIKNIRRALVNSEFFTLEYEYYEAVTYLSL